MPFYPWVAGTNKVDPQIWQQAVIAHDQWILRLSELSPAIVAGSRPVTLKGKRHNQGFTWESGHGYKSSHDKYYLPIIEFERSQYREYRIWWRRVDY